MWLCLAGTDHSKKIKNIGFLIILFGLLLAALSLAAMILWFPLGKQNALSVYMDSAQSVGDVLIVSGQIENKSEKLHGIPDLMIVIKDDNDTEISTQKFAPPAPLLDAGEKTNFSVQVHNVPEKIAKVSVELND
ncbi:MAG: hypothetical protein WC137_00125 [Alphaproteobacteria bacterium]